MKLVVEYEKTRDRVVEHLDADGHVIGWDCWPEPPPGAGWIIADASDDYATKWRRIRLVEDAPDEPEGSR